jgi:hypothetical protein
MFAIKADFVVAEAPIATTTAPVAVADDDLATARGFGLGMLLGVGCLGLLGWATWWML